ncbi:hypothetical protein [Janthinobacterium sp. LB2P70]|uniref:hypothetical protein n=1 Tax=Janthinobacterium sp. LB2P70 TaxID=3424197 RepID=UPI003F220DC7
MTTAWKFRDAPNTACYTTTDVLNGSPVKHVYHDYDGDWQFHGASDVTTVSSFQIACLAEIIKYNDLLTVLHDLPYGWRAEWNERTRNWDRFKDNPFPSFAENGYYLEDAVWLSEYLTDIKPPPAEMRENLDIASHVKIVFRFAHEDSDRYDGQCERLWVEITAVDEQNGGYIGRIDNAPYHEAARCGDLVSFHSLHVADRYSEE